MRADVQIVPYDRQFMAESSHSKNESISFLVETFYPAAAVQTLPNTEALRTLIWVLRDERKRELQRRFIRKILAE